MNGTVLRFAPVLLVSLACGCMRYDASDRGAESRQGAAATDSATIARLDAVYETFVRAYHEADVDLLMREVYAEDGFYLPPNQPILSGQGEFRQSFAGFLDRFREAGDPGPDISFNIVDRDIEGDLAYDIGIYTLRPAGDAEATGNRGKFIVIWKRNAAGEWRIHADGFSGMVDN
ncbi:MAG: YybH family protein [Gemmatimonadota bacterium]